MAKLGADSQILEPAEASLARRRRFFKVPRAVHCHLGAAPAQRCEPQRCGLEPGYPRRAAAARAGLYEGEVLVRFQNTPEQILQLALGHFIALAGWST